MVDERAADAAERNESDPYDTGPSAARGFVAAYGRIRPLKWCTSGADLQGAKCSKFTRSPDSTAKGIYVARGQDLSNTLAMLHATVMQTSTNLQDALSKGIDNLEASGQAAQRETANTVGAELSRMRNDLKDTRNRLAASRDELSEDVRTAITHLRQEVQKVKDAVGAPPATGTTAPARLVDTEPTAPATPHAVALSPGLDSDKAAPTSHSLPPASAGPATTDTDPPPAGPLPSAPAEHVGAEDEVQPSGLEEQLQQTVRDVLADELSTLRTVLTGLKDAQDAQFTARDEQHQELTEIRQELRTLATSFEDRHAQQAAAAHSTSAPDVTQDHSALLQQAARVSSAILICHRDMWEFITAHAGRHPHFRVPPQITDHGNERVSTTVSGRSLIAVLISLYSVKHTAEEGDGDWELATTLYHRVHHQLTTLATDGEPVTITLDDRSHSGRGGADGATPPATEPPSDRPEAAADVAPPHPSE